jgi:hypothetical protein
MAFKARNKDNGIEKVVDADLREESSKKLPHQYSIPDDKNWTDQAIKVLNILESKGINIYDENRTPGMYLKRGEQNLPNNKKIKEFLGGLSEQNNQQKQPNIQKEEEKEIPENVFNFLINQK